MRRFFAAIAYRLPVLVPQRIYFRTRHACRALSCDRCAAVLFAAKRALSYFAGAAPGVAHFSSALSVAAYITAFAAVNAVPRCARACRRGAWQARAQTYRAYGGCLLLLHTLLRFIPDADTITPRQHTWDAAVMPTCHVLRAAYAATCACGMAAVAWHAAAAARMRHGGMPLRFTAAPRLCTQHAHLLPAAYVAARMLFATYTCTALLPRTCFARAAAHLYCRGACAIAACARAFCALLTPLLRIWQRTHFCNRRTGFYYAPILCISSVP